MRILFVIRQLARAGAERQLVTLATALAERDHEVVVASFRSGALDADLDRAGVTRVSLEAPSRWSVPLAARRLLRLARSFRPDVIHGYLDAPNILASVIAPFAPPARAAWAVQSSEMNREDMMRLTRFLYALEPRASRFAAVVISNSESGRRDAVRRGYRADRLVVVPQGVDTDRFQFNAARGVAFRERFDISDEAILLGRVARLHPMKDYESFIDAVAGLAAEHGEVRAACVGTGPADYAQRLRDRAAALGVGDAIVWCEPTDDMTAFYSACDVHVSSSRYGEGHPTVVAEAMACLCPCVVTDVGDSGDLVGPTGLVVPPGDTPALTHAIADMLERTPAERRLVGTQARTRVCEEFSVAAQVDRTLDALEKLVPITSRGGTQRS